MTEFELQSSIRSALKTLGYEVLSTSAVMTKRIRGISKGVPDLIVSHTTWPVGLWLGLEVKLPKGTLQAEQKALLEKGRIVVVRSVEDAKKAADGALVSKGEA